eukprot:Sspe_Gene.29449::Locus_14001_Transcript_1_1_Confidence_1.000_Length_1809::g.29449::m.29449
MSSSGHSPATHMLLSPMMANQPSPLSPTQSSFNGAMQMTSPPVSPLQQAIGPIFPPFGAGYLSPVGSVSPTFGLSPSMLPMCNIQGSPPTSPLSEGSRTLTINLEQYVPAATNPQETQEEKNFRHALPPRLLHKHKSWVEAQLGGHAELSLNVPPGLVELSRKRLSRGDSRYKGLSEMNVEARVTGVFEPAMVHHLFDELFIRSKVTVKSSRRRCFEVINNVKQLTELTGAFVISRPVDECIDIYGPRHAVEAAQNYLISMQSQSGVSKKVISVSSLASSAIIKARRMILPREQGSLFVEPPPRGQSVATQPVTLYAYSDASKLDHAEAIIKRIEEEVIRRKENGEDLDHFDPHCFLAEIEAEMLAAGCGDKAASDRGSVSHSPPPLLEDGEDGEQGARSSPRALLSGRALGGSPRHLSEDEDISPKARPAAVLRALHQDVFPKMPAHPVPAPTPPAGTIKPSAVPGAVWNCFPSSESSQGLSSPPASATDGITPTPPDTPNLTPDSTPVKQHITKAGHPFSHTGLIQGLLSGMN